MIRTLSYKTKQFLLVLIKSALVVGAFLFVYYKLTSNDALQLRTFTAFLHKNDVFSVQNILFLIVLTILNWFFEIQKWKYLVSSITSISLKNAAEQSLGALTASLLTPNRIGDYGAKAIYYPKSLRKKIMLLNLLGHMMQMTATLIFGGIGLMFFFSYYSLELDFVKLFFFIIRILTIVSIIFYILKNIPFKIKGFSFKKIMRFVKAISMEIKIKGVIFSMIRYLIFSFQFYVLLQIFEINIDYLSAMMVISTIYLVSSILPSIIVFDVVIKGSVAVYLFSMVGVNGLTVLCIVTLMWFLNFAVPSVFGSYYVLNFNLSKVKQIA